MSFSNSRTLAPDHEFRHVTCEKTEAAAVEFIRGFGSCTHSSKQKAGCLYDIERLGYKIDVKGKERSVDCKPEYSTDTHSYQDSFNCDIYIFASYNKRKDIAELMGWEWRDDYLSLSDFVKKGSIHDNRKQSADGNKMQYGKLQKMEKLGELMSGEFWIIKDKGQLDGRLKYFREWLLSDWDWNHAVQFKVSKYQPRKSRSQENLSHVWYREISEHLKSKGYDHDQEEVKFMMKYKFLGTEDVVVGSTTVPAQVRSTTKLGKGEMMEYMEKVQAWAFNMGCVVTCPEDSEYMKLKEA